MSNDGRLLFCYTVSSEELAGTGHSADYYPIRALKPPFEPVISAIDTASNKVIATYEWFESFRAAVPEGRLFANQFLAMSRGRLIVASRAISFTLKPTGERLEIFSGQSPHPTYMIDPGGHLVATMLSQDGRLLFAAVEETGRPSGALHIVDIESGASKTCALTDRPTRLIRLGSKQEPWVLGHQEMRSLSESGEPADRRILLNQPRKSEGDAEGGTSGFLDGYPGETIALGEDHAAILITKKDGTTLHRVALIDLKQLQLDSVIQTMSAAERAGIKARRIMAATALSAATLGNVLFIPNLRLKNEALAARPDGRFLYALDADAHEVTVVGVQTATVVSRIPVDHSIFRLQVSSDGKHLLCIGKTVQKINLASNTVES